MYRLFGNFVYQPYLDLIQVEKFRVALTRFRVSAHRLAVESGRWHKPDKIPYNERKCQLCNCLEDEFHFLLECPLNSEIRKLYIKGYYWKHPNMVKFIELLKSENEKTQRMLAIFIYKGFEKRNSGRGTLNHYIFVKHHLTNISTLYICYLDIIEPI